LSPAFQVTAVRSINEQLESLRNTIKELEEIGGDARDLQGDIAQLIDLKNNLPKVIRKLKDVYTVDMKEENFADGLTQILRTVQEG
jgi:prefoldin subunit 5